MLYVCVGIEPQYWMIDPSGKVADPGFVHWRPPSVHVTAVVFPVSCPGAVPH